jgi:hypothetical protein
MLRSAGFMQRAALRLAIGVSPAAPIAAAVCSAPTGIDR